MRPKESGKRGKVRTALIAAGHKIFSTSPVDAVSIDDIVAAAGVSKGSFYNHFEEKVDILYAVRDEIKLQIIDEVEKANSKVDDAAVRVARALSVYFRFVIDNPNYISIILKLDAQEGNSISRQMNRGAFYDAQRGIETGRFLIPSAESAAAYIVGVGYAGLANMINDQNVSSVASLGRHLIMMVLRGLGLEAEEAGTIAAVAIEQIVRGRDGH